MPVILVEDSPLSHPRAGANTPVTNSRSLASAAVLGPPGRSLPVAAGIGLAVAAAAWLCQGTLAFAYTDGPRLVVLPLTAFALLFALALGTTAMIAARARVPMSPLWLLTLVLLPFLPVTLPAALLVWSGPLRMIVWFGVALLMLFEIARRGHLAGPSAFARVVHFARMRPRATAGLLAAAVFTTAFAIVAPALPRGDEPHYLVITQSLLLDGDLRIENNHRRGDYQAFYQWPLAPHYLRRGRDGEIYSIHAPGISALVAPAFALGGYRAAVILLIALAACGGALVWHVGWLATRSVAGAWFGWAAVVLAPTTIFHSFTVFPDGVGGVVTLTGVWALLRAVEERKTGSTSVRPWLLHGAALALLPWLHTRFAILAGSLGALVLLRLSTTRNPAGKAVAFLSIPAVSALCWVGFFIAIYGTPDPSAPYGGAREFSLSFIPGGLTGLLFDQRFGLLTNAPVLVIAVAGIGLMLFGRSPATGQEPAETGSSRRLAIELLFVIVPYLLTVANFAMWWGGWSAPARFAAAVVPTLAIPSAFAWSAMRSRASRYSACFALAATAFLAAVLIVPGRGALAFNTREGYAHSLTWLSRLADLGQGMPAWFRDREPEFFLDTVVWAAIGLATWRLLRTLEGSARLRSSASFATAVSLAYASAFMLTVTITWSLHGADPINAAPAQIDVLRRLSREPRLTAWQLNPLSRIAADRVPSLLRIDPGTRFVTNGGAGRNDRPLLTLPAVPAGRYRIRARTSGQGGWLMIGIGQDQFALKTVTIASPPAPIEIDFPVDVRALIVRGDDDARRVVRELVVEPVSVVPAKDRLTAGFARQAVRIGSSSVYFLDDRSFPEPEAFWAGGAQSTSVVFDPDDARPALELLVRNAPVANTVTIQQGNWREVLQLAPGEERQVRVPMNAQRGAALVTIDTSAGFRPSEIETNSRDHRFLGVWIKP